MEKEDLIKRLRERLSKEGVTIENTQISEEETSKKSYEISVPGKTAEKIAETLYNIFKPGISEAEWSKKFMMAISGDGQELRRITTLHSSSLLALLFFCSVNKTNPIEIGETTFDKVYFEVKNKVFKNANPKDKPSNVDIMLVSNDNKTILFLESKFTEYEQNGKVEVSEKYHNFYSHLLDVIPNNLKFCNGVLELKEGRNSQYIYGIKQMFSHLIGLLTEPGNENSDQIKEFIRKAERMELGCIVFNWNQSLYKKYNDFYNNTFQYFETPSIILEKCLDEDEVNKEKISKLSILPNLLSYQDVIRKNPSFKLSKEIKRFYNL